MSAFQSRYYGIHIPTRIALISFRRPLKQVGWRQTRREDLLSIFAGARIQGATHVLLPGYTFVYTPEEHRKDEPNRDLEWLARESLGLHVMAEQTIFEAKGNSKRGSDFRSPPDDLGYVLIEDGIILPQRIRQVFSESGQVRSHNAQYVQLADEFFSGERTVSLGGISFFILVCGESNFLYNMQTQGNRVCLRHAAPGQTLADFKALEYRVAFNPAHTEMGNLGKMYRRWEFLSKSRIKGLPRTCLFTTNVERHSPATSAMYCFENQKQRILHSKRNWPEDRSWIMDLIPI